MEAWEATSEQITLQGKELASVESTRSAVRPPSFCAIGVRGGRSWVGSLRSMLKAITASLTRLRQVPPSKLSDGMSLASPVMSLDSTHVRLIDFGEFLAGLVAGLISSTPKWRIVMKRIEISRVPCGSAEAFN